MQESTCPKCGRTIYQSDNYYYLGKTRFTSADPTFRHKDGTVAIITDLTVVCSQTPEEN